MQGPRHEKANMQSDFYRRQYHKVLRWLVYTMVIIFLLIGGVYYLLFVQPTQSYYGNTPDGKIIQMPLMSRG